MKDERIETKNMTTRENIKTLLPGNAQMKITYMLMSHKCIFLSQFNIKLFMLFYFLCIEFFSPSWRQ